VTGELESAQTGVPTAQSGKARLLSRIRRFGPVTGVTLMSQLVSAAVLLLLPQLGRSTADIYSLGIQTGYASIGGVVIGVVYNLAVGRPDFRHWKLSALAAFIFSLVLGAVTWVVIGGTTGGGRFSSIDDAVVLGAFALGGGFLGVSGTFAVRLACLGRPVPLVAATVFPATALLLIVAVAPLLDLPIVLPALLWCLVCASEVFVFARLRRPGLDRGDSAAADSARRQLTHALALAVGVITSSILPSVYLASLAQLPPGTTSVTFLVSRIGTAAVGLGVNSLLLATVNWRSGVPEVRRLAVVLVSLGCGLGLVYAVVNPLDRGGPVAYVALVLAWLALLIAGALTIRIANARRFVRAIALKVGLDLLLASAAAVYLLGHPAVGSYFAAYMLSQAVTTAVFGFALHRRGLAIVSILAALVSIVIILEG
jgi:hypothetical protein